MFVSSLYVRPFVRVLVFFLVRSVVLWRGSVRACPCTSPRHKGVRALCMCLVSSLYVRPFERVFVFFLVRSVVLWRGSVRACPCTSPPHKDVRANRVCALVPVSFILHTHLCLYPFDHLARAVISKTQQVVINDSGPQKRATIPCSGRGWK